MRKTAGADSGLAASGGHPTPSMKYSLLINAGPDSAAAGTALAFATALLARHHTLYRLFFYRSGVLLARPVDEPTASLPLERSWQQLIEKHRLDAVVCITAAVRAGLISEAESRSGASEFSGITRGFEVSGLGQWADAMANSDRVLSFG